MKYILLLILFTVGCSQENCSDSDKKFRDYSYNERVKVISGFYKGQTGKIVSHSWVYTPVGCNIPGFEVRLDSTKEVVTISQFDLYVE